MENTIKRISNILKICFLLFISSCDETPPFVNIIYPTDTTIIEGLTIIQAVAYDNDGDGKIVSVDFFIDGIHIGSDNKEPWEYPWNVSYWADDQDHIITAKAYDYSNNVGESNIVSVNVPEGIIIIPTLIYPMFLDTIDYTDKPTFSWFGLPNTNKYEIEIKAFSEIDDLIDYNIYIEEYIAFENPDHSAAITDTFYIPISLATEATGFYWHIRCENELGNFTEWSDTWVFRISGPLSPNLASPAYKDTLISIPTFQWGQRPGAYEYNIKVGGGDICDFEPSNTSNCFTGSDAINEVISRESGNYQEYTPNGNVSITTGIHWWKVRSKNNSNIWGDWSHATAFEMLPPSAPDILYPQHGSIVSDTNQPEFNWTVIGSDSMHIQISDSPSIDTEGNIIFDKIDQNNNGNLNLADFNEFLNEGTYFWRIQIANDTGAWGDWSQENQFRISGPIAPNIIEPSENKIFIDNDTLIFSWDSSPYANLYQIQINYDMSEYDLQEYTTSELGITIDETSILTDESYYRIRAKNNLDYWGDWSSCDINSDGEVDNCDSIKDYIRFYDTPEVPIIINPLSGELLEQPIFRWENIDDDINPPDQYKIQLTDDIETFEEDSDQDCDTCIFDEIIDETNYSINNYDYENYIETSMYWRVKSIINTHNGTLEGEWSNINNFAAIRPLQPILESPSNNININENLQFEWTDVEGALNYQIWVSENSNFNNNSICINSITDESQLYNLEFINNLEEGNYYWKVRAKSELGIWSEFSDYYIFNINSPGSPSLTSPEDLLMLDELPELVWESSVELTQYKVEITNDRTGAILIDSTTTTNYIISIGDLDGGTHSWRISGMNNIEVWSDWSETRYFWIPFNFNSELIEIDSENFSISKNSITTEEYIDFLNEAYHDSLEYLVNRGLYVKGYCDDISENEEQIFIKRANAQDIYPYNLATISWDNNEELFYFDGSNDLSYENHPMIFVSWCGALAFTKHYNLELPSIQEWENSVINSGWSNDVDSFSLNYFNSGDDWDNGTTPVNIFQNSFRNLNDPLGNIWEWTNLLEGSIGKCKGGSYLDSLHNISIDTTRSINNGPNAVNKDVGFRVIKR